MEKLQNNQNSYYFSKYLKYKKKIKSLKGGTSISEE